MSNPLLKETLETYIIYVKGITQSDSVTNSITKSNKIVHEVNIHAHKQTPIHLL